MTTLIIRLRGVLTSSQELMSNNGLRFTVCIHDTMAIKRLLKEGHKVIILTDHRKKSEYVSDSPTVPWIASQFPYPYERPEVKYAETIDKAIGIIIDENEKNPDDKILFIGSTSIDAEVYSNVYERCTFIVPNDAPDITKEAADIILKSSSGHGCIDEIISMFL